MAAVVVFSTFPGPEKATEIARALVSEQLAACVNLVPTVRSIYRWEGELLDDEETLAIIKTTAERLDALMSRLLALHPYEVPEAVAMPVTGGSAPYLAWLAGEVR